MAKKTAILAVRIVSDAKNASRGFDAAERRAGKFAGVAGKLSRTLKVGVAGAAGIAAAALTKGFGRLRNIERARKSLEGLGYTGKQIDRIYTDALAAVDGTAFGVDSAMQAAAPALSAGVKAGKELEKYLKLVGDAAAQSGTDFNAMARMMNKVEGAGRLTGDVINQMGENGLHVTPILAEAFGKSTEEIRKMASQGDISAEQFRKALENKIGGSALKMGETVDGAWANMWASMGRIGANLLSGIFAKLPSAMGKVTASTKKLEPLATQVGEVLADIAATVVPALITVLEKAWTVVDKVARILFNLRYEIGVLVAAVVVYRTAQAAANAISWATYLWASKDVIIKATQIALTKKLTIAQKALNTAWKTNPLGVIITAATIIVALLVTLYRRNETFRKGVQALGRFGRQALGWVVDRAKALGEWIRKLGPAANATKTMVVGAFNLYTKPLRTVIDLVKRLIDWIKNIKWPSPPKWLSKVGGFVGLGGDPDYRPRPPGAPGGGLGGGLGGPGGSGGWWTPAGNSGGLTIIIQGAVDPIGTAKQVERITRRGRTAVGASA